MRLVTWNVQGMARGWRTRRGPLVAALRGADPDVVALQECAWRIRHQSAQLGRRMDMRVFRAGTLGLLSRDPATVHAKPLRSPARGGSKRALVADIEGIRIAVVHLPLDDEVRASFTPRFVRWAREAGRPFVLCGDFNERPDAGVRTTLLQNGFTDAWTGNGGQTWPSDNPRARIDFVFLHGGIRTVRAELLTPEPSGSDHAGLLVEIAPAT